MTAVFEKIIEMSLTSAVVIVVVMAIRLLLRKAPRKYSYALWIVAAFRLVCPVSFRAVFSIFNFTKRLEQTEVIQGTPNPIPSAEPLPDGFLSTTPGVTSNPPVLDPDYVVTYPVIGPEVTVQPNIPEPEVTVNLLERAAEFAAVVWLIGLVALVIYGIVSYVRLRRRMSTAVLSEDGVWLSDQVQSPFILGFVKPKIYLPFGLSEDEQRYVLAHERYHLKRFDHIVRPLSFLILAVHWFNPFVWAAYYLMGADMEMSCDEKVLSTEENIRKAYSTTLLSFAANRRFPAPSPLAFGEGGVKKRIKNALNWKKPRTWVTVIAIIVCIVVIVVCAANPKESTTSWVAPEWAEELREKDVEFMSVIIWGEDGRKDTQDISQEMQEELITILNSVPRSEFCHSLNNMGCPMTVNEWLEQAEFHDDTPEEGTIRVSICLRNSEHHGVLTYQDGQLYLSVLAEKWQQNGVTYISSDRWSVESTLLGQFICQLSEQRDEYDGMLDNATLYVSVDCVYQYPPISALMPDDSGKTYLIGDDLVAVLDKRDNDAGEYFFDPAPWQTLTAEEWDGLFMAGFAPDISGYQELRIRRLGEEYALVDLDGTLWMLYMPKSVNNGVYHAYELVAADRTAEFARWEIDLTGSGANAAITVEGTYAGGNCVAATIAVTNSDGTDLWRDGFTLGSDEMADFYLIESNGKPAIFVWYVHENESNLYYQYRVIYPGETAGGMRFNTLRCGLTEAELVELDLTETEKYFDAVQGYMKRGTLLLGVKGEQIVYSTPENSWTSVYPSPIERLTELKKQAEEAAPELQTLAVHTHADLTHDGVRETITLTYREDWQTYYLTVENAAGEKLWQGEAGIAHAAWDGFYLYEKDGKHYLMRWLPAGSTGIFSYRYEIFSLTETGEQVPLTSGAFFYDTNSVEGILSLKVELLEAFEAEVNALLKNSIVLITTEEGVPCYSPENWALGKLWAAPVHDVREWKQVTIDRLPLVMAYMELKPELLACVEEQVALRMGSYDLAYVEQVENIRTPAVGATGGHFIYRVTYKPGDYDDATGVTWQDKQCFYIVAHERSGETSGVEDVQWYFVTTLSEEELQSRFNTPDMLNKYSGDLYLAAVVETVNQWRVDLSMYYVVDMPLGERDYITVAAVYGKDPAYYYSFSSDVISAGQDGVRYYVMGVGNSYSWAGNFKSFRTYRVVSKGGYLQSVEEVETLTKNAVLRNGKPYTGDLSGMFSCLASRYVQHQFEQDLTSYTFYLQEDGFIDVSSSRVGTGPAITYSGTYQYDEKTGTLTAKVTGRYASNGDVTTYPEAEVKGKLYEYGGFVHFICESSGIHILSEKDPLPLTFVPNTDGWANSRPSVMGSEFDGNWICNFTDDSGEQYYGLSINTQTGVMYLDHAYVGSDAVSRLVGTYAVNPLTNVCTVKFRYPDAAEGDAVFTMKFYPGYSNSAEGKYLHLNIVSFDAPFYRYTEEKWFAFKPNAEGEPLYATGSVGLAYEQNGDGTCTVVGIGTCTDSHVVIPSTFEGSKVTTIGDYAFYDCSSLTSVIIPDSVTTIASSAFHSCSSLTSVVIPDSVTSIGASAFHSCSNLTSIVIPDGVTTIAEGAFTNCTKLTSATIGDSVTSVGAAAFYGCSSLTSVVIPDSVTSIGTSAFSECTKLTNVTIGNSVTAIGEYAFYDCAKLTGVTIGDSVTTIDRSAFQGCSSLTSIIIPDSVTTIARSAFQGCSSLTSIVIPNRVTRIGMSAFQDCTKLTGVTIGGSVTSIEGYAFQSCSSLTSVIIPAGVTYISANAFNGCSGLTGITIPASVQYIWEDVFYGCSKLTEVHFGGTKAQWKALGDRMSLRSSCTVYCSDSTIRT